MNPLVEMNPSYDELLEKTKINETKINILNTELKWNKQSTDAYCMIMQTRTSKLKAEILQKDLHIEKLESSILSLTQTRSEERSEERDDAKYYLETIKILTAKNKKLEQTLLNIMFPDTP